ALPLSPIYHLNLLFHECRLRLVVLILPEVYAFLLMFGMFHPAASHIVPCLDPIDSSSLAALAHSFDFGTCFPAVADVLLFHSFVFLFLQKTLPLQLKTE